MVTAETLTEEILLAGASARDLRLAEPCIGQVVGPRRDGEELWAQVQESDLLYRVGVSFQAEGIFYHCTCGSSHSCRHVYALLLKWLRDPTAFSAPQPSSRQEPSLAVRPVAPPPARQPEQPPAWLAAPFAERQQRAAHQLTRWLGRVRLQDLRQIARRRGWRLKGTDKAGITRQVAEAMAAPEASLQTALGLDAELQRVLATLVLLGHGVKMEAAARVAERWGRLSQPKQLANYALRLQELGLALPAASASYGPHGDFCPDVVGRWLLPLVHQTLLSAQVLGTAEREPVSSAPAEAGVHPADPLPFVRSVVEIALLLERSPLPLRPPMPRPVAEQQFAGLRGWDYDPDEVRRAQQARTLRTHGDLILTVPPPAPSLPDEAIARLAPVAGDAERLEFIYALLVESGIFMPGSPVTVWPEVKRQYLSRSEAAQRAILARAYLTMTGWSEVWGLWPEGERALQIKRHAGYVYYTEDKLRADLAGFRQAVARALACLPDGEWVRLAGLYPLLRDIWPRFDEPVQQGPSYYGPANGWFLAQAGTNVRFAQDSAEDWDLAQGRFVRRMLAGPLHWLGLADLRFEAGELAAFRLHGLAGLFWDRVDAPPLGGGAEAAPPDHGVTIDGNRICVRPSAISAQAHGLLEEIAQLTAATIGRFEYELDAGAAYRAFQAGAALAEIIAGWQRLLPLPMPEAIRAQLARWWQAYGRVRIYEGLTVIEYADDYALAEMKATTSLAQHIIAEISPRLVIVEEQAVPTLVAELEKAGYTPKQTDQV